jgi:hypothetical protein
MYGTSPCWTTRNKNAALYVRYPSELAPKPTFPVTNNPQFNAVAQLENLNYARSSRMFDTGMSWSPRSMVELYEFPVTGISDPNRHYFWKLDPDPHNSEKLDPDTDPH